MTGDWEIKQGDVREVLAGMEAETYSGAFCDPPYALTGSHGQRSPQYSEGGKARSGETVVGFMGMRWDSDLPSVETWREVYRVLKPGAFLFAFGGTRTHHWLMCAIEDAGFEVRDCMMWLYGSGFPKSLDISKAIDKAADAEREDRGSGGYSVPIAGHNGFVSGSKQCGRMDARLTAPATDAAKLWDGYGTALKPAYEPIIVAMKPCEAGSGFARNALAHGVAGLNIEAGRIAVSMGQNPAGRWPANLILSHTPECRMVGTAKVRSTRARATKRSGTDKGAQYCGGYSGQEDVTIGYGDVDGKETVKRWDCVPECPVRMLDEQSGESRSPKTYVRNADGFGKTSYGFGEPAGRLSQNFGDQGGASRFFYCAKASASERGAGNGHPCVKPLDLCRYLAKLILPPGDDAKLLVPFSGSGSEMIGAREAGWKHITGIEMSAEYIEIAERRLRSRSKFGEAMTPVVSAPVEDLPLFEGLA